MFGRVLGILLCLTGAAPAALAQSRAFEFVAMGDMPYTPEDYAKVDHLIDAINARKPALVVHVGDIISGRAECSDENLARSARQLERIEAPLIYTPGDNEWTDCHRPLGGRFDPLERLVKLRSLMFPAPGRSLGKAPIVVEAQSLVMPEFAEFHENVRFERNGVHFATAHVVGSNNNYDPSRPATVDEFSRRNRANLAWIERTFQHAIKADAKALVIAWQGNVHPRRQSATSQTAFGDIVEAIDQGAHRFKRPLLVIYGDEHTFDIARFNGASGKPSPGALKLMVFGDRQVHAVRVSVDPDMPGVFGFTPLIVPANGLP
jgi:hypothetical protein